MPPVLMPARLSTCLLLAALLMMACTPASHPASPNPAVEQVASTLAAVMIQTRAAATAAAALIPPTPATTPTTKPTLFISASEAICRSGPGPDFQVIANLATGTSVDLIGRDTSEGYWVVLDPATHSQCWVSIQDATPAGSFDLLPEVTAEPITVPVPLKPEAAGSPDFACDNSSLTVVLRWYPPASPVNGYRIYRKGAQVADVPVSQTQYTEKIPFVYGSSVEYSVAAFNEAGVSPRRTWNVHCP